MTTGTVNKQEYKDPSWIKVMGLITPYIIALVAFTYAYINTKGESRVTTAIEQQRLCYKVDSIAKNGIEKDKRVNEMEIVVKDFKITMVEYAQQQNKMYKEAQDINKMQTIIMNTHMKNDKETKQMLEYLIEKEKENN
jgi:hypothetical protein